MEEEEEEADAEAVHLLLAPPLRRPHPEATSYSSAAEKAQRGGQEARREGRAAALAQAGPPRAQSVSDSRGASRHCRRCWASEGIEYFQEAMTLRVELRQQRVHAYVKGVLTVKAAD